MTFSGCRGDRLLKKAKAGAMSASSLFVLGNALEQWDLSGAAPVLVASHSLGSAYPRELIANEQLFRGLTLRSGS